MNSGIFQLMALVALWMLMWRIFIVIRLDSLKRGRSSSVFFKFILGAYALEAFLPILRRGQTDEELRLIKKANVLLVIFYILTLIFFGSLLIMFY